MTVIFHENYQNFSGVDLNTGNAYQVNSASNAWDHISGEGGVDYMENQTVVIVSQGSAPNLTLHTVTCINVSASGEASAEIVDMYLTN
ncbi:MAG: hypothetical protein IT210_13775 [Armatimonadetes bacterium]|nr:hypothetical protein [Armatimonadota bacterium]